MFRRPALFLDRDGVINLDHGYVHKKENFDFIDGIFDLVRTANRLGYLVIVVTNQAGIARGYYSEQDFLNLTDWMEKVFESNQTHIDATFYCPHHPVDGIGDYLAECECRKPKPGMFLKAKKKFDLDMAMSIMLGDSETDIASANLAGVGNILYIGSKNQVKSSKKMLNLRKVEDFLNCLDNSDIDER